MYDDIILQLIREFQRYFPRNLENYKRGKFNGLLENYKEELECSFQFRNLRSGYYFVLCIAGVHSPCRADSTWERGAWPCLASLVT